MSTHRQLTGVFVILFVWQAVVASGLWMLVPFAWFVAIGIAIWGVIDAWLMGFHNLGNQLFGAVESTVLCVAIIWLLPSSKGAIHFRLITETSSSKHAGEPR